MKFSQKLELFRYIDNQSPRFLEKGMSVVEGLNNSEYIDFTDSDFHYTISIHDITDELISEYYGDETDDSLDEYVYKKLYAKAFENKTSKLIEV
jgi:hypothetical protein